MKHLRKTLAGRARVNPSQLRQWFASQVGQSLVRCERQLLQNQFAKYFGSYALFYNAMDMEPYTTQIRQQIRLGYADFTQHIYCAEASWPVQPESVDVVVLQHSLEFADSAYDLLREAAHTVRPGGYLLILGINPLSFFSAGRWFKRGIWRRGRLLSAGRVAEWLAVLGFSLEGRQFACYRPLTLMQDRQDTVLEQFLLRKQWPVGSCYMLVGRKMMQGALLRPEPRLKLETLIPLPSVQPSSKGSSFVRKKKTNGRNC